MARFYMLRLTKYSTTKTAVSLPSASEFDVDLFAELDFTCLDGPTYEVNDIGSPDFSCLRCDDLDDIGSPSLHPSDFNFVDAFRHDLISGAPETHAELAVDNGRHQDLIKHQQQEIDQLKAEVSMLHEQQETKQSKAEASMAHKQQEVEQLKAHVSILTKVIAEARGTFDRMLLGAVLRCLQLI